MSEGSSIRDLRQWVCWRSEERNGKLTKIPYSPSSGTRARSDDPETWGMLVEAREAARQSNYDGIGFVFTATDPFCGVDLDRCLDSDTGEVEPWALEIIEELSSYTEISPSGSGLHILVRARLPEGGNRKGRVEMYDRGRFFTMTSRRLSGTSHLIEERQHQVEALHSRLFPPREQNPSASANSAVSENGLDDAEILRRAMSARSGERFAALWTGDRSGYASDSEADLALCSMLVFWTGPDEDRIASLVTRSGLMREKWNREDYRRRTIARALGDSTEVYSPGIGEKPSPNGKLHNADHAVTERFTSTSTLPEAVEFPVDVMPASCRPLIEEATAALGCAPELVALPMLATLSSAIGTTRIIEVKGGWREWASLFVAVVASPGAMKTPAAKVAKKPAFDRQRELGKNYADEKEEWKREVREWEVEKRDAQKAGEPAPEQPDAPAMGRCVASDTTVEALVSILEENPRGLLVHRDELAGWVRSMDQYKGGKGSDRQHWLNLWSTDEVIVDRKSRMGEPVILSRPFVSLFGGIQPAMLGELGAGVEDGLMDRFLFAYPAQRHIRFTEHEISAEAEGKYAALYNGLANLLLVTDEYGDPTPKPLTLSSEAKQLFARTVDASAAEILVPGFPARLEGVWAKMRGYLARLSLVFAVCRCVAGGLREERIEAEDVEAAAKLLDYFKAHAWRVYGELSAPDPLDLLAAELRDLLEKTGGRWEGSATELHQTLDERAVMDLPERSEELSKLVLRIRERSPALEVSQGWRKVGGRKGNSKRVLKLALKNAVGPVVTVDPETGGDNGTNSNNSNFGAVDASLQGEDNGNNGVDADSHRSDDARERFTI